MDGLDESSNDSPQSSSGAAWAQHLPDDIPRCDLPMRDLSDQAIWTLSSSKIGFGINELLNDSADKYWQSDGPQPHMISIEFTRKTDISFLMLYLDYKNDESYTPSRIVVNLGSSIMHLEEGIVVPFNEPVGWQVIDLRVGHKPSRAMLVQLQVAQNHQNGRDTHIRHIRVVGPAKSRFNPESRILAGPSNLPIDFQDVHGVPLKQLNSKLARSMVIR